MVAIDSDACSIEDDVRTTNSNLCTTGPNISPSNSDLRLIDLDAWPMDDDFCAPSFNKRSESSAVRGSNGDLCRNGRDIQTIERCVCTTGVDVQ